MPLELQNTTLKNTPFFDDFDNAEASNYHRILFRPSVSVQARELTQLQTILQNQIERFGENIYKTGTIIKGVTQYFDANYAYIKINDNQIDGQAVDLASYNNGLIINEFNGLKAVVVNYVEGLQSQNPDLATLYLKYLNTGSSQEKAFSNTNILTIYNKNRTVVSVTVDSGGSLYSNSDTVVFTSAVGGTGAVAQVITFANGTIKEILVTQGGQGYTAAPTVSVTSTLGSGADLTAKHFIAQVQVANGSYTAPVGTGYAVSVSDGIIFQKGHFVKVDPQVAIASKYTTTPNNAVVGFYTEEKVVNSGSDSTLLDNAAGSLNESAPGAYRLQLIPRLLTKTTEQATTNTSFFTLVEFQNGRKVRQTEDTEFNSIGRELARRTYDESGNYVVTPFPVYTESIEANNTHLNVAVGAGTGYIEGYRVRNSDNILTPMRKGTNTQVDSSQTISTNYGNYVEVREFFGVFNHTTAPTVSLRNTASTDVTNNIGGAPRSPGSQIGTAKLRNVVYQSGIPGEASAIYRLYLFDIEMAPGFTFEEVRAVSITGVGVADTVLDIQNRAILQESSYDTLVFNSGTFAIKELTNEEFIYRGYLNQANFFSTGGVGTLQLSGSEEFPYTRSSTLNDTQEIDFLIIPTSSAYGLNAKTGVVQTFGNTTVQAASGSSTQFFNDYNIGEFIYIDNTYYRITRIINNTRLEVAGAPAAGTGKAHYIGFPANVPLTTLRRSGAGIAIDSTGKIATITLGASVGTLSAQLNATIYYNVKVVGASQKTKSIQKNRYVKISNTSVATSPNGPWCLGVSDVNRIVGVYRGSGTTFNETSDVTRYFILDNGQRDNYYGLAFLRKNPNAPIDLSGDVNLLVKIDHYDHSAGYYVSAESYPVDDATTPLPSDKIRTENIDVYRSTTGKVFDLRDAIDFRPKVTNTVTPTTTIASAPVVSSTTRAFGAGLFFPTPNESFNATIESYLSRIDRVTMDSLGNVRITEGNPANVPSPPAEPAGTMTVGLINVPPYPTLSPTDASASLRPDLATRVLSTQQRRYTMKDLSDIDNRISRLEYYSLLNALEQDTKNLLIPSEANSAVDRFKNGFFVDPFNNYDVADVNDNEYSMFIDVGNSVARSKLKHHKIDLAYYAAESSNVISSGDQVILQYDEEVLIEQPFATKFRNTVENQYHYKGTMFLFPNYDNYYDTTVSPAQVTIDLASAIDPLVWAINASFERLGGKIDITETTRSEALIATNRTRGNGGTNVENVFQQTTTNSGSETRYFLSQGAAKTSTQSVGDFVTNMTMQPFIRPQAIKFIATGLRPGARHYIFFDKRNVTNVTQPAVVENKSQFTANDVRNQGNIGDGCVADSLGVVAGTIYLPGSTFFCGEREVTVIDVDSLDSETSASSKSVALFNAYNFSVQKKELSFNTKAYTDINITSVATPYTSSTRQNISRFSFVQDPPRDPIAQSFKLQAPDPALDGVTITSIDVFFKRKDPTLGVNIEIREVILGTPTNTRVPFGYARLASEDVNVSDDASAATKFTFQTPVYLKANEEYAFVIFPDANSPEYLIFTGEAGGADLTNPTFVKKNDWGLGAMFLSTNGSTWTNFQYEDIKFRLRRAVFSRSQGTVVTIPDGYEFLNVTPIEGAFRPGEPVAQRAASYLPGRLVCNVSSTTVTGINTAFTSGIDIGDDLLVIYGTSQTVARAGTVSSTGTTVTGSGTTFLAHYAAGDYVRINNEIREVISVSNNTQMIVDAQFGTAVAAGNSHFGVTPQFDIIKVLEVINSSTMIIDKLPRNTTTAFVIASYQKVVRGVVDLYNSGANTLFVKQSTASNSTFKVVTGRQMVGSVSDAAANVISIDDLKSNFTECHISTYIPPATSTSVRSYNVKADGTPFTVDNFYGVTNKLPQEGVIKSRSNEISGVTIVPSFKFIQTLTSVTNILTPLVDLKPASVVVLGNDIDNYRTTITTTANTTQGSLSLQVSNSNVVVGMGVRGLSIKDGTTVTGFNGANVTISTAAVYTLSNTVIQFTDNETKGLGISKNRYISKRLILDDGLDAEDIKVYLTAFKPSGSVIDVYAKIHNSADGETFETKDWTLLQQTTAAGNFSDSLNEKDFREYEYSFPITPPSIRLTGSGTTATNSVTVTGSATAFATELSPGDIVKLWQDTTGRTYDIRVVATVASATSITLTQRPSFADSGVIMEKVVQPKGAFKYIRNENIVRYHDSNSGTFNSYKTMAIKVVIKAEDTSSSPVVSDIRALAVST